MRWLEAPFLLGDMHGPRAHHCGAPGCPEHISLQLRHPDVATRHAFAEDIPPIGDVPGRDSHEQYMYRHAFPRESGRLFCISSVLQRQESLDLSPSLVQPAAGKPAVVLLAKT